MRRAIFSIVFFAASAAGATPTRDECLKAAEDAQLLRIKTQLVAARDKLVVCGNDACPKLVKKDCSDWLDEVDHAMPTIVLGARDPDGKDLTEVRVTLDGNPIAERLEGKAFPVDPGSHVLRFEAGGQSREQPIVVREGEKSRVVSVVLGEPKVVQPVVPVTHAPLVTVEPPPRPISRAPSAATWVIGGLGLATLVASGIVGTFSLVRRQDLYDSCGAAGRCAQSDVDQVYSMYDLAYAGAAIGGAFFLTGVILFFTTRPSTSHVTANASGLRVTF